MEIRMCIPKAKQKYIESFTYLRREEELCDAEIRMYLASAKQNDIESFTYLRSLSTENG